MQGVWAAAVRWASDIEKHVSAVAVTCDLDSNGWGGHPTQVLPSSACIKTSTAADLDYVCSGEPIGWRSNTYSGAADILTMSELHC